MERRPPHSAGAPARGCKVMLDGDAPIVLDLDDLCRNTLILGSSGSGKTTRAFNPLLAQMLELGSGAFILAPKREAAAEAVEIARRAGREALVIEPGSGAGLELLSGIPELDASALRDALFQQGANDDPDLDAAVARVKNVLRLLRAAGHHHYSLERLHSYCFDERYAAIVRVHAADRRRASPNGSDDAWTIDEALDYEDSRYLQFTQERRRGIHFALSRLLEPFREAKIVKTFVRNRDLLPLESVLDGRIVVLHVPFSGYDRAAQAIYAIAKHRFLSALEQRPTNAGVDQRRPVVLAIDEYERSIAASDANLLAAVRTAGCMVLATTCGFSSLYAALPQRHVDAALQNFTQKIFFKTDDPQTLTFIQHLGTAGSAANPGRLFAMTRDQALCHLTVGDRSLDDVLTLTPLFIGPHYIHERPQPEVALDIVA